MLILFLPACPSNLFVLSSDRPLSCGSSLPIGVPHAGDWWQAIQTSSRNQCWTFIFSVHILYSFYHCIWTFHFQSVPSAVEVTPFFFIIVHTFQRLHIQNFTKYAYMLGKLHHQWGPDFACVHKMQNNFGQTDQVAEGLVLPETTVKLGKSNWQRSKTIFSFCKVQATFYL